MSGSDGPSSTDGGPSGDSVKDCSNLIENTVLNSPNSNVIEHLKVGDELSVELLEEIPPKVVALFEGDIAGSITIRSLARLIECLENDYPFLAIVKEIDGGMCRVQIRPVSLL